MRRSNALVIVSLLLVSLAHAEVAVRARAEQALRESETRFRTLADGAESWNVERDHIERGARWAKENLGALLK